MRPSHHYPHIAARPITSPRLRGEGGMRDMIEPPTVANRRGGPMNDHRAFWSRVFTYIPTPTKDDGEIVDETRLRQIID
jgi:hypothetical protein